MKVNAEELLTDMCRSARTEYVRLRRAWHETRGESADVWGAAPIPRLDGGAGSTGIRYKPVWPKLVQFALVNEVDLVDYMRTLFRLRGNRPPEPNDLAGPAALAAYRQARGNRRTDSRSALAHQRRVFNEAVRTRRVCKVQLGWSDADVYLSVLGDLSLELSALFRYALAARLKLAPVAEMTFAAAVAQYLADPTEYGSVWGPGWVPSEVAAAGAEARRLSGARGSEVRVGTVSGGSADRVERSVETLAPAARPRRITPA